MRTITRVLIVVAALALSACSFKLLKTVDDTESSWRQVETPVGGVGAAGSAPATGAPVGADHGY